MDRRLKIELPDKVEFIINKLMENGFEAFAVGGCVRDSLLGREPNDWDITTSAKPEAVKKIFSRTIDTGIEHGTVTVMLNHQGFEVTTYRIDGEYEDNRHPKEVVFTPDLKEDLRRRDFTINAMAYNHKTGIVDEFGGIEDLETGVIRCVGVPEERFHEDALRILRAVRFASQMDFRIDSATADAIRKLSENLRFISQERIQAELEKLLMSSHPERIETAYKLGITKWILPEFDEMMETPQNSIYHKYNVGEHTVKVIENIEKDHYLRWAALLHDIGKPSKHTKGKDGSSHFYGHGEAGERIAVKILRRLKFDNKTVKIVSRLVKYHDYNIKAEEIAVRETVVQVGNEIFPYLLKLRRADLSGKSEYSKEITEPLLKEVEEIYDRIIKRGDCLARSDMAVNGRDLIEWGMKPGEEVGNGLDFLFHAILENPSINTKEQLHQLIRMHNS